MKERVLEAAEDAALDVQCLAQQFVLQFGLSAFAAVYYDQFLPAWHAVGLGEMVLSTQAVKLSAEVLNLLAKIQQLSLHATIRQFLFSIRATICIAHFLARAAPSRIDGEFNAVLGSHAGVACSLGRVNACWCDGRQLHRSVRERFVLQQQLREQIKVVVGRPHEQRIWVRRHAGERLNGVKHWVTVSDTITSRVLSLEADPVITNVLANQRTSIGPVKMT